mmetsp:Transcript_64232/g.139821  ORF Transcript_64232/g.139821 Transcript_64232/m.139821 type:complete len:351 (+) Transcript_64232:895-1947(+)
MQLFKTGVVLELLLAWGRLEVFSVVRHDHNALELGALVVNVYSVEFEITFDETSVMIDQQSFRAICSQSKPNGGPHRRHRSTFRRAGSEFEAFWYVEVRGRHIDHLHVLAQQTNNDSRRTREHAGLVVENRNEASQRLGRVELYVPLLFKGGQEDVMFFFVHLEVVLEVAQNDFGSVLSYVGKVRMQIGLRDVHHLHDRLERACRTLKTCSGLPDRSLAVSAPKLITRSQRLRKETCTVFSVSRDHHEGVASKTHGPCFHAEPKPSNGRLLVLGRGGDAEPVQNVTPEFTIPAEFTVVCDCDSTFLVTFEPNEGCSCINRVVEELRHASPWVPVLTGAGAQQEAAAFGLW